MCILLDFFGLGFWLDIVDDDDEILSFFLRSVLRIGLYIHIYVFSIDLLRFLLELVCTSRSPDLESSFASSKSGITSWITHLPNRSSCIS